MRVKLDRFTRTTHVVDNVDHPTAEHIEERIGAMCDDWSTTIELATGENAMLITASSGRYAVMVNMGNGNDFFDLVGEPGAIGDVAFVHGGQPAEHPVRHVVKRELAVEAARSCIRDGGVSLPENLLWERQSQYAATSGEDRLLLETKNQ